MVILDHVLEQHSPLGGVTPLPDSRNALASGLPLVPHPLIALRRGIELLLLHLERYRAHAGATGEMMRECWLAALVSDLQTKQAQEGDSPL